jgi:two-component system chemotaxis response regulator CheB
LRILIIDESLTIRATLEELLHKDDRFVVVGSVSTMTDGRRLVEALQPDVITFDLMQAGDDGVDFLKGRRQRQDPPCVVISSRSADGELAPQALATGAAAWFEKSRLIAEAPFILREIQLAALVRFRERVAALERDLRFSGEADSS